MAGRGLSRGLGWLGMALVCVALTLPAAVSKEEKAATQLPPAKERAKELTKKMKEKLELTGDQEDKVREINLRAAEAVDHATAVPVSSLKSSIGHLLGAAGAVEAVATLGALEAAVAPPTLNLTEPDEGLDLDYVPGASRPLERNGGAPSGLSNSFGFGGHNVVLCIEAPDS